MKQSSLLILGMHRSGTSALTGMLSHLGTNPGPSLIPAGEQVNPKGFWEHAEITALDEELLNHFGLGWDDARLLPEKWWASDDILPIRQKLLAVLQRDFGDSGLWILKDPRLCRLLPLWKDLIAELGCRTLYVLCLRSPSEVAASLLRRDGLSEPESCLLWLLHMLDAEFQTRNASRVFVSYESLLADWHGVARDIAGAFDLVWPLDEAEVAGDIDGFLDPVLRHHRGQSELPRHPACLLAQEAFDNLSSSAPDTGALDDLWAGVVEMIALTTPWAANVRKQWMLAQKAKGEADQLRMDLEHAEAEIKRVKGTISWRITGPARVAWNWYSFLLRR